MSNEQQAPPDVEQNLRRMRMGLPLQPTPLEQAEQLKKAADKLQADK